MEYPMMRKIFLLGFVFLLSLALIPQNLNSQIPRILDWQGLITDANNQPISGKVNVEFRIYDREMGGSPLWVEVQDVSAVNGYANVYLGTISPLNLPFDKQYWLEIKIGNNNPFPRTRISAVAQSITSITADTATYAIEVLPDGVNSAAIQDGAVTQSKLAPGVQAIPWGQAGGDLAGNYPNPTLRPGVVIENIDDGSITQNKLAPNVTTPPSGPAGGDLTGTYPDPLIAVGAVKTYNISDQAVTTQKIADRAVTGIKIAQDAVGPYQLAPTGVEEGQYGNIYNVGSFMVDEDGRLTWAGNVLIQAASSNLSDIAVVGTDINNLDLQIRPNTVGPDELISTAVTAGTYGDKYNVGSFTVDQDGRLTAAENILIQAVTQDASDVTITVNDINNLNLQIDPSVVGTIELNAFKETDLSKPATPADNGSILYYAYDAMDPTRMRWTKPAVDGATLVWDALTNEFIWRTPIVNTDFPVVGDGSTTYPVTFADGSFLGQMFYWDSYVNDWRFSGGLSPTTPLYSYVFKWVDDGSTGYADWAPDGLTIPFYYMGTTNGQTGFTLISTDLTAPAVAHFQSTTSANAVQAFVPDNNSAGSAIVATGGGSNRPTVHIRRNTDNALANGALLVEANLVTLESNSPATRIDMNIDGGDGYDSYGVWARNVVTNPGAGTHYAGYFNVNAGTGNGVAVYAQGNSGTAIAGESSPSASNSYVARMVRGNEGRTMYIQGASNNTSNLISDPGDIDDAVLVVRNTNASGLPGIDWNTAIKAYGDIWANSAIGASWLIGLDAVVIGDPNGLNTTLTPPSAPGAPLIIDSGIWVDGNVETTGTFIGDGSGLSNIAEANTTASNINGNGDFAVMYYDPSGDWAWTVPPTVDRTALVYENGSLTWSTIAISFADITSGTNTSATMIVADDAMLIPDPINPGIIRANEWVYNAPFLASSATIDNLTTTTLSVDDLTANSATITNLTSTTATIDDLTATTITVDDLTANSATINNLTSTSGTFDFLQVNNQLDVGIGDGNSLANFEAINVIGGTGAYFEVPVIINEELLTIGSATFESNVQIDGNLNVDGDVNFNGRVGVDGDYGNQFDVFVVGADGEPNWTNSLTNLSTVETTDLVASSATINTLLTVSGDALFAAGQTVDFNGNTNFNGQNDFTGTFELDGDAGTIGQVMISQGTGNTPVWTSDLTLSNLTVTNDFISSGSSTIGQTYFNGNLQIDGNVDIGDNTTSFILTLNGSPVPTLGSNTFTGLNIFGTDPSADPIPPGTILAAVTNHNTSPTVVFQNVGLGPVLDLRGVDGQIALSVTKGDALFQGAAQITLSATTYTPDQALIVTAGTPVNEAAAVIQNVNPDGIALMLPIGGLALSTNYLAVPPFTNITLDGEYTVWAVNPQGALAGVDFPTTNLKPGQIIFIINLSGTFSLNVNGLFTIPAGNSAAYVYVDTNGLGTYGWRQLFND